MSKEFFAFPLRRKTDVVAFVQHDVQLERSFAACTPDSPSPVGGFYSTVPCCDDGSTPFVGQNGILVLEADRHRKNSTVLTLNEIQILLLWNSACSGDP